MQLTRYSDYALRVLMYLGLQDERLCSVAEIASAYDISRNHLVKVVHHLAKSGFVETVRGRQGGLRLARAPSKIRVGAVYRCTEPGFLLAECFEPGAACGIAGACALRRALDDALRQFLKTLDGYTLADLLVRPAPLGQLLQIEPTRRAPPRARAAAGGAEVARARPGAQKKRRKTA